MIILLCAYNQLILLAIMLAHAVVIIVSYGVILRVITEDKTLVLLQIRNATWIYPFYRAGDMLIYIIRLVKSRVGRTCTTDIKDHQ